MSQINIISRWLRISLYLTKGGFKSFRCGIRLKKVSVDVWATRWVGGGRALYINSLSNQRAKKRGKGSSIFYDPRISFPRLGVKSGESSTKGSTFYKIQ